MSRAKLRANLSYLACFVTIPRYSAVGAMREDPRMKVAIRMCDCTRMAMTTLLPITGTSRSPMGMPSHLPHDARAPLGRFVRHLLRAVRTVDSSWMGAGVGDPPEGHGRRSQLRSGPRRALQPL